MGKYGNRRIEHHGMMFDSVKEAARYDELLLLERAGAITGLQRQVRYKLLPSQKGKTRSEMPVAYIADFVYREHGKLVVEDVKGMTTPVYVIKRKLMKFFHDIEIQEV